MTEPQKVPASPVELQKLAQRITDANTAKQIADNAASVALDLFTLFCEAHGVPGATLVGLSEGHVIVTLPEPAKPELVPAA